MFLLLSCYHFSSDINILIDYSDFQILINPHIAKGGNGCHPFGVSHIFKRNDEIFSIAFRYLYVAHLHVFAIFCSPFATGVTKL